MSLKLLSQWFPSRAGAGTGHRVDTDIFLHLSWEKILRSSALRDPLPQLRLAMPAQVPQLTTVSKGLECLCSTTIVYSDRLLGKLYQQTPHSSANEDLTPCWGMDEEGDGWHKGVALGKGCMKKDMQCWKAEHPGLAQSGWSQFRNSVFPTWCLPAQQFRQEQQGHSQGKEGGVTGVVREVSVTERR